HPLARLPGLWWGHGALEEPAGLQARQEALDLPADRLGTIGVVAGEQLDQLIAGAGAVEIGQHRLAGPGDAVVVAGDRIEDERDVIHSPDDLELLAEPRCA